MLCLTLTISTTLCNVSCLLLLKTFQISSLCLLLYITLLRRSYLGYLLGTYNPSCILKDLVWMCLSSQTVPASTDKTGDIGLKIHLLYFLMFLKFIKVGISCVIDSVLVSVLNDLFSRLTHPHHQVVYVFLLVANGEGTVKDPLAVLCKSLKVSL